MVQAGSRQQHCVRQRPHFAAPNETQAMAKPILRWQVAAADGTVAFQRSQQSWWPQRRTATRLPVWLAIVATLALFGALLVAFQQVVAQAVQQGESRRRDTAAHAEGIWRCNALRGQSNREGCLAQRAAVLKVKAGMTAQGQPLAHQ